MANQSYFQKRPVYFDGESHKLTTRSLLTSA
jgi:hypothetical protein